MRRLFVSLFVSPFVSLLLAAAVAGCTTASTTEAPRQYGVSETRLKQFTAQVRADVDKRRIPGAVILVARDGKVAYQEAIGMRDPASGAPMTPDAIFRIYSMTKPIVSVGVMMLVEDGRIQLSDPVSRYVPELKDLKVGIEKKDASGTATLEIVPAAREPTIQDLLRHTSGIAYDFFGNSLVKQEYKKIGVDGWDQTNAEMVQKLTKVPLQFQPGTTWDYGLSTDVLGYLIERVTGQSLADYLQARILGPLGMKDTAFQVDPAKQARLAESFAEDADTKGQLHWSGVRATRKRLSGGAALVSTAGDYLRFAQMMLNGGTLDGTRIISRKTVEYMTSDHLGGIRGPAYLPGAGYGFGLGFAVRVASGEANTPGSTGDYNWGGWGGTYFWVDPKERLIAIWMMQAPGPRGYYRVMFRNAVYSAIE
ncbi:MAG TPA: serine hydrolase domain-containing protein [Burkholderiaceae bacterium]|nr:serine hydrolase domain-containing protein [Burkholderiaceae bacterium]